MTSIAKARLQEFYCPENHPPELHATIFGAAEFTGQLDFFTKSELRGLFVPLNLGPGDQVVDVGSGYGGPAMLLAQEFGARVVGIELSPSLCDRASKTMSNAGLEGSVRFLQDNVVDVELPDGEFDAAVAIDSIVHMPDLDTVFRRMASWVRPGGRVVIASEYMDDNAPASLREQRCQRGVVTGHSANAILGALESAGFQLISSEKDTERRAIFARGAIELLRRTGRTQATENMQLIYELADQGFAGELTVVAQR